MCAHFVQPCSQLPCNAASVNQDEMKRVLDVVVTSEENRLAMGRALIDAQLENNSAAQAAEQKQYLLEQRILELEGKLAQEFAAQVRMRLVRCIEFRSAMCGMGTAGM